METEILQQKKIKRVPKLRFGEFEEEFRKKGFGELVERSKAKYNPKLDSRHFPCIELECLSQVTGSLLYTFDSREQLSIKNHFKKGEILFGKLRPYLKKFLKADFEGVCSSEIWVLKGKEISNVYLYQIIQTEKFNFEVNNTSGSKMPRAEWSYISSINFYFPQLPEQKKIASFLSAVDKKIQQLTRKKELLETYKKGVMQQLFSQDIRFKPSNGKDFPEWKEKKLGKIAFFSKGKGISKNDISLDGLTQCIRYGELYTIYKETIDDTFSKTNLSKAQLVLSEAGDVIIPASGETRIDIATASCVLHEGIGLGGDLNIIRGDFNGVFLAYYLNAHLKTDIARLSQGSSVMHLYSSQLRQLKLEIPSIQEQQKIADFLSAIDRKIETVQQQITKTQSFKKGLLQQMFV